MEVRLRNISDKEIVLLEGPRDKVMDQNILSQMPLEFLHNGPGNQEAGSINPISPLNFAGGYLWNFDQE